MFDYATVNPIYGPPGTGKTTTCVALVSDLIEKGVDPRQIAYVAFTNKAANEARERVAEKLSIPKTGMTYFSTIHAMGNRAYKAEFPDSLQVMRPSDFEAVGERVSLPVRQHWRITEDADFISGGSVEYGPGDQAMSQINLARARCIETSEQVNRYADPDDLLRFNCFPQDVERFESALRSYKEVEGKYDFNDMLDRSTGCTPLPIRFAIIDEAQDLSAAQWRVCHYLLRNCETIWVAGDDDQAIYRFSGADANTFLQMGKLDTARVLNRTYRLPPAVYNFAHRIIANVSDRVSKEWHTEKEGGSAQIAYMDQLNIDEGEWLFLVRNRGFMKGFEERLRAQTHAYNLDGRSSLTHSHLKAIRAWEHVRKGERITAAAAHDMYQRMQVGHGIMRGHKSTIRRKLGEASVSFDELVANHGLALQREVPWFDALLGIPAKQLIYMRGVAKRGELFKEPRISLATIHGVKGGEADNVVVLPQMGRLTWDQFLKRPDDEHRCAYVAATRAKENLYILQGQGDREYPYL